MSVSEHKNESPTVKSLLSELETLQSKGDSIYPKGIFPSKRYHPFLPYKREDDNLFFTTSIIRILQGVENGFSDDEKTIFNRIKLNAFKAYPLFKNKDGLDTFNFWQTKPSRHFPNGKLMHRFKHFQIPDDVDDTALVFLTQSAEKERVSRLRKKLKLHANLASKRAFNPRPEYRDLKCYSTFFGKKMYIEFDVCVLSNLMSLILDHFDEDELNEYDHDTLEFIALVIEGNDFETLPFYSAPNYPSTELILYHVARLIPFLPARYAARIRDKVEMKVYDRQFWAAGMNQLLMENAAIKLGCGPANEKPNFEALEDRKFFFFHAGMITAFENTIAQSLAANSFFHLRYTSSALNKTLLVENLTLSRPPNSPNSENHLLVTSNNCIS